MISNDKKISDYLKFIFPLCLFSLFQHIYSLIDIVNGSLLGTDEMSYIVYIDQVMLIILAFANSSAIAISVLISKRIEQGKIKEIKSVIVNSFIILFIVALVILLFISFFDSLFLKLIFAPEKFYQMDKIYLQIRAVDNFFLFFNLAILAIEKAKGNTKKVFYINSLGIAIKIIASFLIQKLVTMSLMILAIVTITPSIFVFLCSLYLFFNSKNLYKIQVKDLKVKGEVIKEFSDFALPLFLSMCVFNIGKTFANFQALQYGVKAVGYLGISNRLIGLMTAVANGLQEAISILLARYREIDKKITKFVVKISFYSNLVVTSVGVFLYLLTFKELTLYFANQDPYIAKQITEILLLELIGAIFLPFTNFMIGVLYGFERTKTVFIISFMRIFIFRNLILFIFSFTNLDSIALGLAMLVSHLGTFIFTFFIVRKEFKNQVII
ncbi:MAG: MATE family efflux transporter [Lactovum sp.]